jgi:hypothetical protein
MKIFQKDMKRKNIIFSLFIGLMALMVSCEAIVDEKDLVNNVTVEEVELVATQNSANGNLITLSMNTPGVTGYWDYNLGKALTNRVQFVYPIPGTSTFTYVGTLGGEFFEKTIYVQVDVLDTPLNQDWYDLVSEDTSEGKAWVFAGTGGDEGLWWFMSPPDNPDQHMSVWWNAGGTCCPPSDAEGRMVFDLDGAANYTYYAGPDAAPQIGSFVLDVANRILQFGGGLDVLGADPERKSPTATYQIISLTDDELILYVPNNVGGTGWTWIFRPA